MTTLTIIRGLPGSGKSTLAERLVEENYDDKLGYGPDWWEADLFFEQTYGGGYRFDPKRLSDAHQWCYSNTLKSLRDGVDTIVSNTFTRVWEMQRYLDLVKIVPDLKIKIIEVKTQYESIHGVPSEKTRQMALRWESIPQDVSKSLSLSVEVVE